MSYENDSTSSEFDRERHPLNRFSNDLHWCDDRFDLCMSLQRYIYEDIPSFDGSAMSEEMANAIVDTLAMERVLPTEEQFDTDRLAGKDQFRLALYTVVVPMYEASHTDREIDRWLPNALDVVLDKKTHHQFEPCSTIISSNDTSCSFGQCPAKVVAMDTIALLRDADFDSNEYRQDSQKKCNDVLRRLACVVDRNVVGLSQETAAPLESAYMWSYSQRFPSLP